MKIEIIGEIYELVRRTIVVYEPIYVCRIKNLSIDTHPILFYFSSDEEFNISTGVHTLYDFRKFYKYTDKKIPKDIRHKFKNINGKFISYQQVDEFWFDVNY